MDISLKYLKQLIAKWGGNPNINNPSDAIDEILQLSSDREESAWEQSLSDLKSQYFSTSPGDIHDALTMFKESVEC